MVCLANNVQKTLLGQFEKPIGVSLIIRPHGKNQASFHKCSIFPGRRYFHGKFKIEGLELSHLATEGGGDYCLGN